MDYAPTTGNTPTTVRVILDTADRQLLIVGQPGALATDVTTTAAADAVLRSWGAGVGTWTPVGDHWPGAQQSDVTVPTREGRGPAATVRPPR